ncbi:MAG TPA: FMN-binding protein [Phototrophicaceae bacterium]|nr:FMN-binding protein [Phototrophicaceae bacterium]
MRKFFVSGFVIISFVAYAVHDRLVNSDPANVNLAASSSGTQMQLMSGSAQILPTSRPIVPISQQINAISPTNPPVTDGQSVAAVTAVVPTSTIVEPSATPIPPTMTPVPPTATPIPPTDTPQSQGQYKDGTYTGPSVDAFYGQVQVQITVQGGKLTNVQFLDYPHDRRTSQMINSQAMPWLTQEAIQAQSAYVNIISGATLTSQAFAQSLYTALNQAAN